MRDRALKPLLGVGLVAVALGIWLGARTSDPASPTVKVETWIAIAIACNLLFGLWLWYRARPGSGDAMLAPTLVLLMASMLVGHLPRLFWPDAEGLHIAGIVLSGIGLAIVLISQIRRRRLLRRATKPATGR